MGTSRTVGQFLQKLDRASSAVEIAGKTGVAAAAAIVKHEVEFELAAAGVRNMFLRGVGRHGAKIGVATQVKPAGVRPFAIVKMTGPAQFIEFDMPRHWIPKTSKTGERMGRRPGGRGKRRQLLAFEGGGFAAFADHPGTTGKHPWRKGVTKSIPKTEAAFAEGVADGIRKAFR